MLHVFPPGRGIPGGGKSTKRHRRLELARDVHETVSRNAWKKHRLWTENGARWSKNHIMGHWVYREKFSGLYPTGKKNGSIGIDNSRAFSLINVFFLSWENVLKSTSRSFLLPGRRWAMWEPSGTTGLCLRSCGALEDSQIHLFCMFWFHLIF